MADNISYAKPHSVYNVQLLAMQSGIKCKRCMATVCTWHAYLQNDSLRKFYTTLLEQNPKSAMALKWYVTAAVVLWCSQGQQSRRDSLLCNWHVIVLQSTPVAAGCVHMYHYAGMSSLVGG